MSVDACAALVARADPDRFRTAMLAPMPARADLMVLYALNVEVSRAPWVSQDAEMAPMIGEMRVQWWADAVAECFEGEARRHEVVTPLAEMVARGGIDRARLTALVEARRQECRTSPLDDAPEFLAATAGGLMALATGLLGGDDAAALDLGWGAGAAALIRALPAYAVAGRSGFAGDVAALAREGQVRRARARRQSMPKHALPALLAGWDADAVLADAVARGEKVRQTPFAQSEARRRATLLWRKLRGRA